MPFFKKRPLVIEAFQMPQEGDNPTPELVAFLGKMSQEWLLDDGRLAIDTLEGTMVASPGDWIIKGVTGEYYPCKPEVFRKTYEQV
jgi:hypothetical protein